MSSIIKLPGLIDCHVHLRDPGATQKEDFSSGTKAALAGGFTTVIDMPNNPQPTTTLKAVNEKIALAKAKSHCPVYFYLGADQNNSGEFKSCFSEVKGLKIYMNSTTGPLLITKLEILNNIFRVWPEGKPILVHAEDATIATVLGLVQVSGKHVHFCHVSQKCELELIIKAKEQNLPVTCEVTPHHLFLDESNLNDLGPYGIVKPALRTKKDTDFLWKNLKYIDCFATDHAPHTKEEKEGPNPPLGLPGLETALPLLLTAVNDGRITINDIILRYHDNPGKLFEIKHSKNTYTEIDLHQNWEIKNENLITKCGWSQFNGWKVKGKVIKTVINGRTVYENGCFCHREDSD